MGHARWSGHLPNFKRSGDRMKVVGLEFQETGDRKVIFEIDYVERRLERLDRYEQRRGRITLSLDEAIKILEEEARGERRRA